ncbi:translesion DNA synthesis-associated protein ImuA [Carnimonas bestiolae]|uniref:translesion DNA synthesis-associated protein ImuA n=1 Tax=Carnimonas bestiolae TaxID=3402172 RepID=UPI003EDC98B9
MSIHSTSRRATHTDALQQLMNSQQLWTGRRHAASEAASETLATGHRELDRQLAGGWPRQGLIELLADGAGLGELTLLWPLLAQLTQQHSPVVLIAPPWLPCAHAWAKAGVSLEWVTLLDCNEDDVLWAAEQCLRSGCCGAVLCWPQRASTTALRRLHSAADSGSAHAFVWRQQAAQQQASPAVVRLLLQGRTLSVLKCRGARPAATAVALS